MKIFVSYFYKVRFFKRNYVPFSTAIWPPAWFGRDGNQHKDKNGVWNGISITPLVPGKTCDGLCRGPEHCKNADPTKCDFLKAYRAQLDALDFEKIVSRIQALSQQVMDDEGIEEEPVAVLLVFETPSNPCSERRVLQEWFKDNGMELKEWEI